MCAQDYESVCECVFLFLPLNEWFCLPVGESNKGLFVSGCVCVFVSVVFSAFASPHGDSVGAFVTLPFSVWHPRFSRLAVECVCLCGSVCVCVCVCVCVRHSVCLLDWHSMSFHLSRSLFDCVYLSFFVFSRNTTQPFHGRGDLISSIPHPFPHRGPQGIAWWCDWPFLGVVARLRKKWLDGVIEEKVEWWRDDEKIGRDGVIAKITGCVGVIGRKLQPDSVIAWLPRNYEVMAWSGSLDGLPQTFSQSTCRCCAQSGPVDLWASIFTLKSQKTWKFRKTCF